MERRDTYLAHALFKDKFVALDNENNLSTWDMITGKLIKQLRKYPKDLKEKG
jgi:hypothetical protein